MLLYTRESSSMFLEYVLLSLHFCLAAKDMNIQSFQSYFSHRRCHYASSLSSGFHNQTLINLTPWETIGLRKRERWINIPNVSFSRTVGTYWKILKSCLIKAFYKRRRGIKAARVTRVMDAWRSIRKVTMIRWGCNQADVRIRAAFRISGSPGILFCETKVLPTRDLLLFGSFHSQMNSFIAAFY